MLNYFYSSRFQSEYIRLSTFLSMSYRVVLVDDVGPALPLPHCEVKTLCGKDTPFCLVLLASKSHKTGPELYVLFVLRSALVLCANKLMMIKSTRVPLYGTCRVCRLISFILIVPSLN